MKYSYCNTTKIFFASDLSDISNFLNELGFTKVLVISGGDNTSNIAKKIEDFLNDAFLVKAVYGVRTNPRVEKIDEIVKVSRVFCPDVILTIGGGSVHDTGKAVSVMINQEGEIEEYTVNGTKSVPGIKKVTPVITVPTICGSGAEVSPASLIKINDEKRVIFSPLLHPIASFVFDEFAISIPKAVIARSVFDSFIQALEGYISTCANCISDSFAEIVFHKFIETFDSVINGTLNDKDIEKLYIASIFSSYVCSTASVGAIHAISNSISGHFDIHHGTALAMIAKSVLEKNLQDVLESRIQSLCKILNIESGKESLIEYIETMIDKMDLLYGITVKKISESEFNEMILESNNGDMNGNPRHFSDKEIKEVLGEWYEVE